LEKFRTDFDLLLVGGGLQNGLIALGLAAARPQLRLALVERGAAVGGNHTWSAHRSDVSDRVFSWLQPAIAARWQGHEVAFPARQRVLEGEYFTLSSERFAATVSARLQASQSSALFTHGEVQGVTGNAVSLSDGRVLRAGRVIDARGPAHLDRSSARGFQKFVGLEVELRAPHGLTRPMLMDARVKQVDGFRFIYVLPLSSQCLLIEDTYYSDVADLNVVALREEIARYAQSRGWDIHRVLREEQGALPIPLRMAHGAGEGGVLRAGYAAGFFHPTTGYSLPIAARFAELVVDVGVGPELELATQRFAQALAPQQRFTMLLNRWLFRAIAPEQRFAVLERFYRLPEPTIERFYALQMSALDRARIVCGRPPQGLSLSGALAAGVSP
jgi:lycopene beta-cyclase